MHLYVPEWGFAQGLILNQIDFLHMLGVATQRPNLSQHSKTLGGATVAIHELPRVFNELEVFSTSSRLMNSVVGRFTSIIGPIYSDL